MIDKQHLLTSKQMAEFVARGFLRFDELAPDEINQEVMRAIDTQVIKGHRSGTPLSQCYQGTPIRKLLDLPPIQGLIHSLVGEDPLFDHDAIHVREPNEGSAQGLHADSIIDCRTHFDIQLMYFPHDVPLEMGGTLLLPGSHFRRVNEMDVAAYQNMRGQIPMVCKAGSVLALHHGIWHCGRQNQTDRRRYMFKLRLNPTVRQLRLWNTDDLDKKYRDHQEIYAGRTKGEDDIQAILGKREPWFEAASGRLEVVNRIKLWRFLTGDESFDVHYWMSRLENMPA
ncbi:MAG: phytanoyl-CoA dioxygenase family protein [Chloroflexi bacterium]|nr:phytanoyl-CoA dioxygenase family protein [Chloroflexota bacterium]